MVFIDVDRIREITFQGKEDDYIICDFEWSKPKKIEVKIKGKLKSTTYHPVAKMAKIKLDMSNPTLLEKVNMLTKRDVVYMKYHIKAGDYDEDISAWTVIDIFDDIDKLDDSNKSHIFDSKVLEDKIPKKDKLIQPRKKADKKLSKQEEKIEVLEAKITELETENIEVKVKNRKLTLEVQNLKKQLQDRQ